MNIAADTPIHLLHRSTTGTLATHSREPQGYPYPTVLPFAPDARHRPVVLVSRLAEHTRNLEADARAGFLVTHAPEGDVLTGERVTLIGRFERTELSDPRAQRYLRYHPEAERYLALGDFALWTMTVERLRYIGGFGTMGWLDGTALDALEPLAADEEAALVRFFEGHPNRPKGLGLMGVDRYGADLKAARGQERWVFDLPTSSAADIERALDDCIARHSLRSNRTPAKRKRKPPEGGR